MLRKPGSLAAVAALAAAFTAPAAHAEWALNMPRGVTGMSNEIYDLHMIMFWICVAIAVVVFGVMIYSMLRFRKSRGAVPDTDAWSTAPRSRSSGRSIPVLILVAMAVPAAAHADQASRTRGHRDDDPGHRLPVEVAVRVPRTPASSFFSTLSRDSRRGAPAGLGHRPEHGAELPAERRPPAGGAGGTKVRLLMTAQDVIHSWWVPAVRRSRGRDPGLRQRALVQGRRRQDGHLPRPVRRALRPRPRLHADRRRRAHAGRVRRSGSKASRPPPQAGGTASRRADSAAGDLTARAAHLDTRHPNLQPRDDHGQPAHTTATTPRHDDHHDEPRRAGTRWVYDDQPQGHRHDVPGVRRASCSSSAARWRMVIRAELFKPGLQFVDPAFFNSMTTDACAGHDLRRA